PLFLLIPPHPPRPTLFPYTTLFRSHRLDPQQCAPAGAKVRPRLSRGGGRAVVAIAARCHQPFRGGCDQARPLARRNDSQVASRRDRKSTRLNSSHLVISYAVFCLKK